MILAKYCYRDVNNKFTKYQCSLNAEEGIHLHPWLLAVPRINNIPKVVVAHAWTEHSWLVLVWVA
jgi:hypothetical protein